MTNNTPIGSSGAVTTELLAADTSMGAVTRLVLDMMTSYYRDAVTLTMLAQGEGRIVLGRGTTPIVILVEYAPALNHAGPRDAGLFHSHPVSHPDGPRGSRLRGRFALSRLFHG